MNASSTSETPLITLATRVTILRILGVPVFIVFVVYYLSSLKAGQPDETYRHIAAAVFFLVALTDALDGYLARSRNETSRLGTILDPIADKGLMLSGLILLTRPNIPELSPHIPIWFTALVISRDVILVAGAFIIHHVAASVHIRPHLIGKAATFFQVVTILLVLLQLPGMHFTLVVYAGGICTAASALIYIIAGIRQLET